MATRTHFRRWGLLLTLVLALGGVAVLGWWQWRYPYGYSHCCDKGLMFALQQYAEDHGGAYPSGEATPDASLSLLYPKYASAELLRGKTVPLEVVQDILARGEKLGPHTCGWHYVEGLRLDDDKRLALLWDKAGLGHFGERLPDGGHTVLFVGLGYDYVEGARWEAFLQEQQKLLADRAAKKK
jgi:hypothetical protein